MGCKVEHLHNKRCYKTNNAVIPKSWKSTTLYQTFLIFQIYKKEGKKSYVVGKSIVMLYESDGNIKFLKRLKKRNYCGIDISNISMETREEL